MPPLSTHFRFAILLMPHLGIFTYHGDFVLGTTAPDAFEPDSEVGFSRHHFRVVDGTISLPDFLKATNFIIQPSDDPAWSFALPTAIIVTSGWMFSTETMQSASPSNGLPVCQTQN